MLTKQQVKQQIDSLPETFSLDELIERLIFIKKVGRAEKQSENNEVISNKQLDQEIEKWFK